MVIRGTGFLRAVTSALSVCLIYWHFERQLNNRPRKVLGVGTPYKMITKILEYSPES